MAIDSTPIPLNQIIPAKFRKAYHPFVEGTKYEDLGTIANQLYTTTSSHSDSFVKTNSITEGDLMNGIMLKSVPHELAHLLFQHSLFDEVNPPVRISCTNTAFEVATSKGINQITSSLTPQLKQETLLKDLLIRLAGPAMDDLLQPKIQALNYASEVSDFTDVHGLLKKLGYSIEFQKKRLPWQNLEALPYLEKIALSDTVAKDPLVAELLTGVKTALAKVPRKVWESGYNKMLASGEICGFDEVRALLTKMGLTPEITATLTNDLEVLIQNAKKHLPPPAEATSLVERGGNLLRGLFR